MKKLMNQLLQEYNMEFVESFDYPARFNEDGTQVMPHRLTYHWEILDKITGKKLLTGFLATEFTAWDQQALEPDLIIKERRMKLIFEDAWQSVYALIRQRRPSGILKSVFLVTAAQ